MKRKHRNKRRRNPVMFTGGSIGMLGAMAAGVVVAYLIYANRAKLIAAFDPTSDKNIFYQGAGKITQAVTGDPTASVGSKIADWFKSPAEKAVDEMLRPTPPSMIGKGYYDLGAKAPLVNPVIGKSGVLTDSAFRDMVR